MISIADWLGAVLYCLVSASCTLASGVVSSRRRSVRRDWRWIGLAALYLVLAAARLGQFEELARASLRNAWTVRFAYEDRLAAQTAAALIAAAILAGISYRFLATWRGGSAPFRIAALASGGMVGLLSLRVISLHATDRLLYAGFGPIRAHYLVELGLLCVVLASTWHAARKGNILQSESR